MSEDFWRRQEANRKAIVNAGIHEVGQKLRVEHYCGGKQSRSQVEAEYRRKQRWLKKHREKYPGW